MRLLDELEQLALAQESPFRAQLLREDLARLRRLVELARELDDAGAYAAAGRRLGWTQGDSRTAELRAFLDPLLDAVRDCVRGNGREEAEKRASESWAELTRVRVQYLVGCLSTPVPRPE